GCGTISHEYLRNLTSFAELRVLLCADLDPTRAKAQAARYGVPEAGDTAAALAHPDVELIVNLTVPAAHAAVTRQALAACKHVWTEKPLATDSATGQRLLAGAARAGLRIGCAPDTTLGAGLPTARRVGPAGARGGPGGGGSGGAPSACRRPGWRCCRIPGRTAGIAIPSSCSSRARAHCST